MSGTLRWHTLLLTFALSATLSEAAPVSDNLAVLVKGPIPVTPGDSTTLPCWLNPSQSAEALEVRWYRSSHFDSPVLLYQGKTFDEAFQDPSYKGRVSFGVKDASSGGLRAGDVSLNLQNVGLEDDGEYTCYVSSDHGYDSGSVTLSVTQTGASPLVSAVLTDDDQLKISCDSEGWYPEPTLAWLDQNQALSSKNTKTSKLSSGLWSVNSWILLPSSAEVSCTVGLPGAEAKVARVHLEKAPQTVSGSAVAGWMAFTLLLIGVLALLGVLYHKYKAVFSPATKENAFFKRDTLVTLPTHLSTAKENYVNVTLCKTGNAYLKIREDIFRDDVGKVFPDGPNVACVTAIRGEQGFTSGQHYWEVSMGNVNVEAKKSWWLGVMSEKDISETSVPTTSNGFWFLSSSPDDDKRLQFNTEPALSLSLGPRPQTVGVYLNYNSGELSFYDVENESLIGTLKANFKGEVFPLFNPGRGDSAPMKILKKEEPDTDSDQNPNESSAQEPNKVSVQETSDNNEQESNKVSVQGPNESSAQESKDSEKEPNNGGEHEEAALLLNKIHKQ